MTNYRILLYYYILCYIEDLPGISSSVPRPKVDLALNRWQKIHSPFTCLLETVIPNVFHCSIFINKYLISLFTN